MAQQSTWFYSRRTIQDVTQKLATTIDAIRRHTSSNHAVILIDFRKAFDNINCLYLLLTLTKLNVDDDTIRYCMAVTADHFGQIQLNNRLSSLFKLRQGNPLSPALFNIGLEPLLHKIDQTLTAVKLENGYSVNVLAYADDITIFVDNEGANLLRKFYTTLKNFWFTNKSRKTVLLAHKPEKYNLPFTKKPINNPDVYYLGYHYPSNSKRLYQELENSCKKLHHG